MSFVRYVCHGCWFTYAMPPCLCRSFVGLFSTFAADANRATVSLIVARPRLLGRPTHLLTTPRHITLFALINGLTLFAISLRRRLAIAAFFCSVAPPSSMARHSTLAYSLSCLRHVAAFICLSSLSAPILRPLVTYDLASRKVYEAPVLLKTRHVHAMRLTR